MRLLLCPHFIYLFCFVFLFCFIPMIPINTVLESEQTGIFWVGEKRWGKVKK